MYAHFSPAQLMDLIAIFGAYITLGSIINTWGLALDEAIRMPENMDENSWLRA
jgi:hypothetical protein